MDSLFKPVLDISEGDFTANQIQGVFGMFVPVLDDNQGAVSSLIKKASSILQANLKKVSGITNLNMKKLSGVQNV